MARSRYTGKTTISTHENLWLSKHKRKISNAGWLKSKLDDRLDQTATENKKGLLL